MCLSKIFEPRLLGPPCSTISFPCVDPVIPYIFKFVDSYNFIIISKKGFVFSCIFKLRLHKIRGRRYHIWSKSEIPPNTRHSPSPLTISHKIAYCCSIEPLTSDLLEVFLSTSQNEICLLLGNLFAFSRTCCQQNCRYFGRSVSDLRISTTLFAE